MNQYDRNSDRKDYRVNQRHMFVQCKRAQYKLKVIYWVALTLLNSSLQINELFEVLLTGDRIETSTLYIT